MDILTNQMVEELIELRRDFHRHAEIGWLEYYATAKIVQYLQSLGIDVMYGKDVLKGDSRKGLPTKAEFDEAYSRALSLGIDINLLEKIKDGYTGVVGTLDTGKEGPVIAFRFDIDAVSGSENNLDAHRPYKEGFSSIYPKSVHSCGHDGHTAIGLVLAKCLKSMRDKGKLKGSIKFIFQPAEEGARGARAMVDAGVLDGVDYLFSGHIGFMATKNSEVICGTYGFLDTKKIDVFLRGVAAHAGTSPHMGNNALLAASTIALGAHTLTQHGDGISRVNVGVLNAGTSRNLVAEDAVLKIEVRGENEKITNDLYRKLEAVIAGASMMYGVDYIIQIVGEAGSAKSDEELSGLVEIAAGEVEGFENAIPSGVLGGSEDITIMMNRVQAQGGKACYIMLGSNLSAGHHQSNFDFDECVLSKGVGLYIKTLGKLGVLSED